jgi:serine O-acetyltransferase
MYAAPTRDEGNEADEPLSRIGIGAQMSKNHNGVKGFLGLKGSTNDLLGAPVNGLPVQYPPDESGLSDPAAPADLADSSPEASSALSSVVDALCVSTHSHLPDVEKNPQCHLLPSRDVVIELVEALRSVLFPGYFGTSELSRDSMKFHVGSTLDRIMITLQEQVRRGLCFTCKEPDYVRCLECNLRALKISRKFLSQLPKIQQLLNSDVQAAYEGDPALLTPDEAIFCYPGMLAITNQRLAHELHLLKVPLIPRIITEYAHSITGIDIHPGAAIGDRFFIDHGTGVVIGETSIIGNGVRIYQGVTLGAKSFPLDAHGNPIKGIPRHPIIEDDVVIYSGATILGRVVIGKGSIIGGNVWLMRNVPPGSRVMQATTRETTFEEGAGI